MNRTLKRPMFRIGGSAGTGITSGLDQPRKQYAGGGSDRMMSNAEKEERAYNLMRDSFDREQFLKERKRQMEMDRKRLEEKRDGVAVADGGRIGLLAGGKPMPASLPTDQGPEVARNDSPVQDLSYEEY